MVMGDSFLEGILYIGIPMTSGGMTAGAVPLSAMYSSVLGTDAGQILTRIAPATVLGNCVAIIFGGLANNIGERKPSLTGNGCLVNDGHEVKKQPPMKPTFALLCTGLIISMAFYELGALCHHFISIVPTYAWMIVAVVIVKGTGILSERLEDAAREWGQFAIHSWTAAALTGIGATLIDLKTILHTITPFYLLSVVLIVGAITLTAGLIGIKMGFYPLGIIDRSGDVYNEHGRLRKCSGAQQFKTDGTASICTDCDAFLRGTDADHRGRADTAAGEVKKNCD